MFFVRQKGIDERKTKVGVHTYRAGTKLTPGGRKNRQGGKPTESNAVSRQRGPHLRYKLPTATEHPGMDKPGEAWRQIVARLFFGLPGTPPSHRPFKRSRYQHPRRLPQKKIAISYQIVTQNANTDLPLRIAVLVFVCLLSRSFRQSTLIERLL